MEQEVKTPEESLIEEYVEQKNKLKEMVAELEKLKIGIEKIFPEKLDARYSRFLEDKISAVTELFKGILEIRKEITKNIKDEFELRSKYIGEGSNENDMYGDVDVRYLVKKIEQLNKKDDTEKKENVVNE